MAEAPRKAADPSPFNAAVSGTTNRERLGSIPKRSLALYISGMATTLKERGRKIKFNVGDAWFKFQRPKDSRPVRD